MKEQSTETGVESRPTWESLEAFARQGVQQLLQQLLEEEVEGVLGRARYERRDVVDATLGYRNGHGKPRQLSAMTGTITIRRPRVRGLEARFESRLLPLFKRRTEEVGRLLPELYLHGLAHGDFDLALRGLLGEAAPLSATSIARLKAGWQAEYESWKHRRLDELEPVYVWADGIYVKAGLEKDKAAMLVVMAGLRDGRKAVLAVESGYRESTESWAALLRDLKGRGLRAPRLLIADGHLGIWSAVGTVFPTMGEQRCWNHRMVNVLDTLPKKLQAEAREWLTKIPYAETRAEAERLKRAFQSWATKKGVPAAGRRLEEDWERLVTFYAFPKEHWKHLRTTNVVHRHSPRCGCAPRPPSDSRKSRTRPPSSGRPCWSRSRASVGWMRLSACRRSPRASCMSTECGRSGATRRPPPDLVYTLLDKTSRHFIRIQTAEVNAAKRLLRGAGWPGSTRMTLRNAKSWDRLLSALGSEPDVQRCVRFHYAVWQQAGEQVRAVDHVLGDLARGVRDDVRRLETVPGVGPVVALTAIAAFGDAQRFASAKHAASYAGLVPSTYQSGTCDRHGHITKRGSAELRAMLCEAAHHARRPSHPLHPYFMKLCARRGYKMAIVAVAHRLCRILYALLRHGTEFQVGRLGVEEGPFTHTVTRQYRLTPKPAGRLVTA